MKRWLAGCLAAIVVFELGAWWSASSSFASHAWVDLAWLAVDGVALWASIEAARHARARTIRIAWRAFAIAMACWTAGMAVWTIKELALGELTPFPSAVDVLGWIGGGVFVAGIVLYNVRHASRALSVKQLADLALVGAAVVAALAETLHGPTVAAHFSGWYIASALVTPVLAALGFVYGLIALWQHADAAGRRVLAPMLGGTLVLAVVGVGYAAALLGGSYQAGSSSLDVLWLIAFLAIATGARIEAWTADRAPTEVRPVRSDPLVPAIAILVWTIAVVSRERGGELVAVEAATGVVLAVALGLRIWATQRLEIELEARLAHVQRLEAVGTLAGGVAHDFNNVLAAATAGLALVRRKRARGDEFDADLLEIDGVLKRATDLTAQLLDLARKRDAQRTPLDPAVAIERVRGLLAKVLPANVKLATELPAAIPVIEVDPAGLEHALLNLGLNARDALGERGGTITIAARGDATVTLEVRDDGPGIPPDVIRRVFEPFFTTKAPGDGTGLGLAMVEAFAIANGGAVDVDSVVGRGTAFRLDFPRR